MKEILTPELIAYAEQLKADLAYFARYSKIPCRAFSWESTTFQTLRRFLHNKGYSDDLVFLGSGISRIVFRSKKFPNVVFKFQHDMEASSEWYGGNPQEMRASKKIPYAMRKYFAKAYWMSDDTRMLISQRAKGMTAEKAAVKAGYDKDDSYWFAETELEKPFDMLERRFYNLRDVRNNTGNFLIKKDKKGNYYPVLVDYAACIL